MAKKTIMMPPRGMRDFYPEDMVLRNTIFDAWSAAARLHGFNQYDACVVESLDLLKRKAGEEIIDQIYAFKDKSNRDLALRPEMTPTLARMVAAHQGSLEFPLKWFTIAQCFRYERTTRGRKREHFQWNLDIIGESSVAAEAEILATATNALANLGLDASKIRIHFSSRALLADILSKFGIKEEHHQATFLALDKRGKIDDDKIKELLINEGLQSDTVQQVMEILGLTSLEEVRNLLGTENQSKALVEIDTFLDILKAYDLTDIMEFDISVVRGLAYYTGIVFEAYDIDKKLRALFGGGRYDNLLTLVGGEPATGVGLGFGDVVIAELLAELNTTDFKDPSRDITIGFMEQAQQQTAIAIANRLRKDGRNVNLALTPEKPKRFFSKAGKTDYKEAVYIGPDDLNKGTFKIKNLETRKETEHQL